MPYPSPSLAELALEQYGVERADAPGERVLVQAEHLPSPSPSGCSRGSSPSRAVWRSARRVHGQVEPGGQAADDQMGDVVVPPLPWQREHDLFGHSSPPSSSAMSCSRRAASSFPVSTASCQLRVVRRVEARVPGPGEEACDLLDGVGDDPGHGAHGRIDAADGVDGAVGYLIDLVQLIVDPVNRPAELGNDGQELLLRSLYQRRSAAQGSAEPECRRIPSASPARTRKIVKREIREVAPVE